MIGLPPRSAVTVPGRESRSLSSDIRINLRVALEITFHFHTQSDGYSSNISILKIVPCGRSPTKFRESEAESQGPGPGHTVPSSEGVTLKVNALPQKSGPLEYACRSAENLNIRGCTTAERYFLDTHAAVTEL
eukprot:479337-Hanusia_phi.AAC.2